MKPISYLSPFSLLSLSATDKIDSGRVKKEKKRLLAEFELEDLAEIEIKGNVFDKSSLIALFEEIEDTNKMAFHQLVWSKPTLLSFLESGDLAFFQLENTGKSQMEMEPETRELLAPYFCFRFNEAYAKAFKTRDWETFEDLNTNTLPIGIDYYSDCYQDTFQFLEIKIESLEELAQKISKGENPGTEVQEACDELSINMLNVLPDHFDGLRNLYALSLEEIAMAVYNRHQRSQLSKLILRQGLKLTLNQDAKGRLNHVLDQLMKIEPSDGFIPEMEEVVIEQANKIKGWHVALAGVVIIKIILIILY